MSMYHIFFFVPLISQLSHSYCTNGSIVCVSDRPAYIMSRCGVRESQEPCVHYTWVTRHIGLPNVIFTNTISKCSDVLRNGCVLPDLQTSSSSCRGSCSVGSWWSACSRFRCVFPPWCRVHSPLRWLRTHSTASPHSLTCAPSFLQDRSNIQQFLFVLHWWGQLLFAVQAYIFYFTLFFPMDFSRQFMDLGFKTRNGDCVLQCLWIFNPSWTFLYYFKSDVMSLVLMLFFNLN